jgi:gliding motility-associated-like protein
MTPQISTNQNIVVTPTADTWYYLQVSDGCYTVLDSMRVIMGSVDITAINITPVTDCSGGLGNNNDGALEIIPNPVSGNYTFTINPGSSNATGLFNSLTSQSYQITVLDNVTGCQLDTVIFLPSTNGLPPNISSFNVNHVTCPGAMDGSIEILGINGTPANLNFDITYTPTSGAPIVETGIITSLPSGHTRTGLYGSLWSIDITDQLGCTYNFDVTINEPDPINLGLTSDEPLCYGQSNGSVYINATGGTLPYTFYIADSDSNQLNQNNSNAAEQIPTGWYYTSLVDDNGCYMGDSLFLDQPDSMFAQLSTIDPPCYGAPYGEAAVTAIFNEQGPVQYSWSPSGDSDSAVVHLDQGSHTITIVDSVGCIWQGTFELFYPDSLFFNNLTALSSLCRGNDLYPGSGTVSATASGGTGTITYAWVGNGQTTNTATWGNRIPGCYIIQATDANGCQIYDSVCVDSLNPIADFIANPMNGTEPVTVTVTDQSENRVTNTWSYYSSHGDSTSNSFIIGYDSLQAPFDTTFMAGDYYICQVVANDFECYDTLCQLIEIYPQPDITLPNVVTINGDGINDTWSPISEGMAEMSCTILNRWGHTVFVLNGPTETWDGTNSNSGKPVSDGVYSFVYTAKALNGQDYSGQGFIHVISK